MTRREILKLGSAGVIGSAILEYSSSSGNQRSGRLQLASERAIWPKLDTYGKVLSFLADGALKRKLMMIDVAWLGCSGCTNLELADAMGKLKDNYKDDPKVSLGAIAWRSSRDQSKQVTQSYKLFSALTAGKSQLFGGGKKVENYSTNPPWWRRHFPQIFFLDGSEIIVPKLNLLAAFEAAGNLFHRHAVLGDSGDLRLENDVVRRTIKTTFSKRAVLLQLLNEHLFAKPNELFQKDAFAETVQCVVDQFKTPPSFPKTCFRFERFDQTERGEGMREYGR